jgi:hypothetical protein
MEMDLGTHMVCARFCPPELGVTYLPLKVRRECKHSRYVTVHQLLKGRQEYPNTGALSGQSEQTIGP